MVVLGGGVIDALDNEMMPIVVETAREHAVPGTDKGVKIVASKLGDDAGITARGGAGAPGSQMKNKRRTGSMSRVVWTANS